MAAAQPASCTRRLALAWMSINSGSLLMVQNCTSKWWSGCARWCRRASGTPYPMYMNVPPSFTTLLASDRSRYTLPAGSMDHRSASMVPLSSTMSYEPSAYCSRTTHPRSGNGEGFEEHNAGKSAEPSAVRRQGQMPAAHLGHVGAVGNAIRQHFRELVARVHVVDHHCSLDGGKDAAELMWRIANAT